MNFKHAFVFAAVALCAVQASEVDFHNRNRRAAFDMLTSAKDFVDSMSGRISKAASSGLGAINSAYENVEDSVLGVANNMLKKVGITYDLETLVNSLKSNIRSCAISDEVKNQITAIKDNVLSCISAEVSTVKEIIEEIKQVANDAKDAPALVQNAVSVCTGAAEEAFNLSRLVNCASSLKSLTKEAELVAIPEAIVKNVKKAVAIAESIKGNGASCVASKLSATKTSAVDIVKGVASCIKSKSS